ncbi:glycosyltransferase family 2 protein [uncultured Roseibium sp.]|uniref:glycosyltransferase family 2 protein n=1 Tax=uncultured Roseibium sp. TaxID=1936171 RepID=UPI00262C2B3C|nr:glycosyltransferase family 2 protein [uncultured Roseibium sp.]
MKLSVVIPCYNEADNLSLLIPRCRTLAQETGAEVILVDNGSSDRTPDVLLRTLANDAQVRSVRVEVNQGYGHGILAGLAAARGDVLSWTHADMQTDPLDIARGLQLFQGAEDHEALFVKGKRYGRPLSDTFFTIGMSVFETLLLRTPLSDINAQPTMFSRRFYESWQQAPHDFSLDLYAYYQARQAGLSVERFPVRFGERAFGVSHWNIDWSSKRKFIQRTVDYSRQLKRRISEAS